MEGYIIYKAIPEERRKIRGRTADELLKTIEKEGKGPKTKEILMKVLRYESPAHIYFAEFECPPVIERGKGALLWDVEGNEYIDLFSGFSVHNLGHCHPQVVEAIRKQCGRLIQWAEMPNEFRAELAWKLAEITPGSHEKKVYYATTGGEAVEVAMKLARYYTGRPNIMAFSGGYHGRTYGAMTATCDAYLQHFQGFPLNVGVVHVPYAYCYRCIYNLEYPDCHMQCTRFIEELFRSKKYGLRFTGKEFSVTNISAILVEPMLGAGGSVIPPKEFLKDLRRIADDYGLLLIADEIQVGWGRTGKWWGCEHSDVVPDIITIGKTVGGGIPLSAAIAKAEIMNEWAPFAHCTTFGGTPLACAVGLAVIDVFEKEKVVSRAARMGEYFLKGFNDLAKDHPLIGHVDGKGLLFGFELVKDQKTKEPAIEELRLLHKECFNRGILWIPGGGFYGGRGHMLPPLVIEKEQIDKVIEVFDEALKVIER